ncbi:hypothetical protein QBC44DRAFT_386688 [Cladorrhinum sp. PSN332]|nr:hypothetical protein QBC44DRAFT_386688 [Cladorrhinum sp. PSN332]
MCGAQVLYRCLEVNLTAIEATCRRYGTSGLVETLLHSPQICRMVKRLVFLPSGRWATPVPQSTKRLYQRVATSIGLDRSNTKHIDWEQWADTQVAGLLLVLLPRLQVVVIRITRDMDMGYGFRLLREESFRARNVLADLRALEILGSGRVPYINFSRVLPLLEHTQTQLRCLTLRGAFMFRGELSLAALTQISFATPPLFLSHGEPDVPASWKQFFSQCPSLRTVSCRYGGGPRGSLSFIGPVLSLLVGALEQAKGTLETLVISDVWREIRSTKNWGEELDADFIPITSLKCMTHLSLLCLDQAAIWRKGGHAGAMRHAKMLTDLIPRSLKKLYLVSNPELRPHRLDDLDLSEELCELAEQTKQGQFPFLQGVYLSGFNLSGREEVCKAFDGTGVTFLSENITTADEWYHERLEGWTQPLENFVVRDKVTGEELIRVKC